MCHSADEYLFNCLTMTWEDIQVINTCIIVCQFSDLRNMIGCNASLCSFTKHTGSRKFSKYGCRVIRYIGPISSHESTTRSFCNKVCVQHLVTITFQDMSALASYSLWNRLLSPKKCYGQTTMPLESPLLFSFFPKLYLLYKVKNKMHFQRNSIGDLYSHSKLRAEDLIAKTMSKQISTSKDIFGPTPKHQMTKTSPQMNTYSPKSKTGTMGLTAKNCFEFKKARCRCTYAILQISEFRNVILPARLSWKEWYW